MDRKINFEDKEKILETSPDLFKVAVSDLNANLNSKLRLQFEEIHNLLDKMADIVVRTEPKKSSFILDCRLGTKNVPKNVSKSFKKKELMAVNQNLDKPYKFVDARLETENSQMKSGKSIGKRSSFYSVSTALPTKKLKLF